MMVPTEEPRHWGPSRSGWVVIDRIHVEGNGVGDIVCGVAVGDGELNGDLTVEVNRWREGPTVGGVAG